LASLVESGTGGSQDLNEARQLHFKACKADYGASCYAVGLMFEFGAGIKRNLKSAQTFYRAGCELKHEPSCTKLN
jgi:TPR repeat protein